MGDFGLSCCILSRVDSSGVLGEHHREVGTRLYAAPEQLKGKCTSKVSGAFANNSNVSVLRLM